MAVVTSESVQASAELGPDGSRAETAYRYDLSPGETDALIRGYLHEHSILSEQRLLGVVLDGDEPIANVARTRERLEFEATFPSNNAEWMKSTYADADRNGRRFLTVFDLGEARQNALAKVVGVMSVSDNPPYMSLEDASRKTPYTTDEIRRFHGIGDHEKMTDVLTVAIARGYRAKMIGGTAVMAMLEGMFVRVGMYEGWDHVVSMIDSRARRVLDAIGVPFKPMHGHDVPFEYFDSPHTYALYGKFDEFGPGVAAHYKSYRWSRQRLRDTLTYFWHKNTQNEAARSEFNEAAKRLGTFAVARNVVTGKGVVDRVVLPAEALALKVG